MIQSDLQSEGWTAVRLGPETLGWAGPNTPVLRNHLGSQITILMNGLEYNLDTSALWQVLTLSNDSFTGGGWQIAAKEREYLVQILRWSKCFIIQAPEGSLDVSSSIVYSEFSVTNLNTILNRFFEALMFDIQRDLNQSTPVEVVHKYVEMNANQSPYVDMGLKWRGELLDDVIHPQTGKAAPIRKAVTVRRGATALEYLFTPKASFRSFVSWQSKQTLHSNVPHGISENVFIVRLSSPEEMETTSKLLRGSSLHKFLAKARSDYDDATFFLIFDGDPIEEWIDGEVVGVEEF